MTLDEFLLARIAEDETRAQACWEKSWRYDDGVETAERDSRREGWSVVQHAHVWGPNVTTTTSAVHAFPDMQHIATWDPARVLAECEAKRRIIGLDWDFDEGRLGALSQVEELLALPYADHPDYQQDWRP